jgi:hypothetical protein
MENMEETCTNQLTFLPYYPYLFTIQLTFLPYFPNHFTIQFAFLSYFPYLQYFLLYFPNLWKKSKSNSEKDMEIMEEKLKREKKLENMEEM